MPDSAVGTASATITALQCGMHDQLATWRRMVQAHGQRLGWKIGFSDRAAQQRMGLAAPVLGYLRRDCLLAGGDVFALPANSVIKAEVEVAIRLGRDVMAGTSATQAEVAIAAYAPAVELVDVTHPLDGLEALLRGNLYHAAVLIGPEQSTIPAAPRQMIQARLSVDGKLLRDSEPQRLPEHFSELVQTTAATLSQHGERLMAGDWIICGAIVEPIEVRPGNRIDIDMSSFERLTLGFSAR
jgi:2-oxo-hept-3-ene-1,7-dioate hydratase